MATEVMQLRVNGATNEFMRSFRLNRQIKDLCCTSARFLQTTFLARIRLQSVGDLNFLEYSEINDCSSIVLQQGSCKSPCLVFTFSHKQKLSCHFALKNLIKNCLALFMCSSKDCYSNW